MFQCNFFSFLHLSQHENCPVEFNINKVTSVFGFFLHRVGSKELVCLLFLGRFLTFGNFSLPVAPYVITEN